MLASDIRDVHALTEKGESSHLEFKKSTSELKSACRTICAFLNGEGGVVIIGVTPKGRIVGQDVSDATQREIAAELKKMDPESQCDIKIIDIPDSSQKIIALSVVPINNNKPYMFDGRAYMRV